MADAFALASAAAERRMASAPRESALPPERGQVTQMRTLACAAAMVGMRLSARCSLSYCREGIYFCGRCRQSSGTNACRGNDIVFVIAGLNPAIHAAPSHAESYRVG